MPECCYVHFITAFANDIGRWVGLSQQMQRLQKIEAIKRCWIPTVDYNFGRDYKTKEGRTFQHTWLKIYAPWLAYSQKLKGALCIYCVLFPPDRPQRVLGSFAIRPFIRYKQFHDYSKIMLLVRIIKKQSTKQILC